MMQGKKGKEILKIITLNIRFDNPHDSLNAWPSRASIVCSFIHNEKPDIIGMQEAVIIQYALS